MQGLGLRMIMLRKISALVQRRCREEKERAVFLTFSRTRYG